MTRIISAFAVALTIATVAASAHTASAQTRHGMQPSPVFNGFGPGEYDRIVNGSPASTPGAN